MKKYFAAGLSMALVAGVMAQSVTAARPKGDRNTSRKEIRVVARNTAADVRAPLSVAELEIARRVQAGTLPCELGQVVVLTPDPAAAGFFHLRMAKETYRVAPEETTTGAIRLEDKAAGVVWLQLANKSMLMSQKQGIRLADECKSPAQILVADAMLKNPPPSVLDALPQPAASEPPAKGVLDAPPQPAAFEPAAKSVLDAPPQPVASEPTAN